LIPHDIAQKQSRTHRVTFYIHLSHRLADRGELAAPADQLPQNNYSSFTEDTLSVSPSTSPVTFTRR
jgi:hypothetical protein